MGFKKAIKKAVKTAARTSAAMITGGASELYKGYTDTQGDLQQTQGEFSNYQQNTEDQNMTAFGYKSIGELVEAQKKKATELEQRRKNTGLASLLGGGTTLG